MAQKYEDLLLRIYEILYDAFGPSYWWPGESQYEIVVGAILTQNTNWGNVERAIKNLKEKGLLCPEKMKRLSLEGLSKLIKPSGFYNQKAKKINHFLEFLFSRYSGSLNRLSEKPIFELREELLSVYGIGKETADSILLYALDKPIFVVDSYTKRILKRHKIIDETYGYDEIQRLFMENLPHNVQLFNEYHALLVRLGKNFCKKKEQLCKECPLNKIDGHILS